MGRPSAGRLTLEVPASPSLRYSSGFESAFHESNSPMTPSFQRRPSPLPSPPFGMDSDEEDETCNDDVVLDYGIREEPHHYEDAFMLEVRLGEGVVWTGVPCHCQEASNVG